MIFILDSLTNSNISNAVAIILAYFIAVVIAFSLHEFSHAFTAYKLGDPTAKALGRLTLNPFKHLDIYGLIGLVLVGFGWAKPVPINPLNFKNQRKGMFLVSISGVLTNIVLAFLFSGALFFFFTNCSTIINGTFGYENSFMYFVHYLFEYSVIVNIALFVFNLIPIYPLDGFNAIQSFCKHNNKFINFMYKYGSILLLIIIITPIFDVVYSFVTNNILDVFFNFWGIFV